MFSPEKVQGLADLLVLPESGLNESAQGNKIEQHSDESRIMKPYAGIQAFVIRAGVGIQTSDQLCDKKIQCESDLRTSPSA